MAEFAPAAAGPSTFGLTEEELIAEASRLWRAGWDVAEITAVLAVPEPDR